MKSYYERNKEKYKQYYLDNREKLIKRQKEWISENYERQLWLGCKARARKNNLPFDIEVSDIIIPEVCPILGITITKQNTNKNNGNSPSVDKIIPSLGYVKSNIQIISNKANTMKSNATPEELQKFSEWCLKTYS